MKELAALLWEPQTQPKRGPRPALTLDAIAHAGIEIADADGLASVTMQRVAEMLGVTKMALYRYVPGKAELIALMTDAAIGQPPRPSRKSSWSQALDTWAKALFERFYRHPWTLETTIGARIMGPNELGWLERAVAALTGSGLDGGEMLDVAVLLIGHVRSLAQQASAAPAEAGDPEQAMESGLRLVLSGREERFPALAAIVATGGGKNQALDFGIGRILDGVRVLIESRIKS